MARLLTDEDLAARWGVSTYTVERLRRSGAIPSLRITPRTPRYRVEDIERYEQQQSRATGTEPEIVR